MRMVGIKLRVISVMDERPEADQVGLKAKSHRALSPPDAR